MFEKKKDRIFVITVVAVVAAITLIMVTAPVILANTDNKIDIKLTEDSTYEDYVVQAMIYASKYGDKLALEEFNNPDGLFSSRDYYIIAYDSDGTLLAMSENPSLVGQNQMDVKDVYGVQSVMQCTIRAGHGGGYVYAISPEWFKGEDQTAGTTINLLYILPVGDKWFVFSGDAPNGMNAQMSLETKDKLDKYVASAEDYINKNGLDAAIAEFNSNSGKFSSKDMTLMIFDEDGKLSVYHDNLNVINDDLRGVIDSRGTSVGRDIYQMGLRGGGYLYDAIPITNGVDEMKFISVKEISDGVYLAGTINIGTVELE